MRSSFNTATVVKRVAMTLLIASGALSVTDGCFSQSVLADPARGGSEILLAQGDAKLPSPDPSYHPKSSLGGDFSGVAAQTNGSDSSPPGQIMRRRMRRRLQRDLQSDATSNDASTASKDSSANGAGANGAGANSPLSGANANGQSANGPGVNAPSAGGPAANGAAFNGGGFGARLRARAQANGLAPGSGAFAGGGFGAGAKRFQGGGFGGGALFGKKALDLTSLNLTPDQKQKIQDARRQVAPKTKEIRKQLVAKRYELRDLMFQPDMNDDLVRAKRKEVRQLQDKIEDLQLNDFLAIRSVLTPDQRQKLTDLKPMPKVAAGQAQLIAPAVSAQPVP